VHKEFVPPGQTANQQFYLQLLKILRDSLRKKRPEIWSSGDWFFHHDSATVHTALSVQQLVANNNMTVTTHPPYSPDLAPCDFFLFPRMKSRMNGKRFAYVREVKKKTLRVLKTSVLKSPRNVFSSGKNVGTSVSSKNGGTLKETGVVVG